MTLDPSQQERGVLPNHRLEEAIVDGVIDAGKFTIPQENIQPASLDLRLGDIAYRMRCSFLPGKHNVLDEAKRYKIDELNLHNEGAVLRPTARISYR